MMAPKEAIENDVERGKDYQRCFWAWRPDGIVVYKKKEFATF